MSKLEEFRGVVRIIMLSGIPPEDKLNKISMIMRNYERNKI
jgi:hypothetical protein